jgi:hypothetical protein
VFLGRGAVGTEGDDHLEKDVHDVDYFEVVFLLLFGGHLTGILIRAGASHETQSDLRQFLTNRSIFLMKYPIFVSLMHSRMVTLDTLCRVSFTSLFCSKLHSNSLASKLISMGVLNYWSCFSFSGCSLAFCTILLMLL